MRSTVGSLFIPAKYTKSVFNVQSPTQASISQPKILTDLNENSLHDTQQNRPNRKIHSVNSFQNNNRSHDLVGNDENLTIQLDHTLEPKSNNNNDSIETNNLKTYTAIPTQATITTREFQYKYDPKTTPHYKKYSYSIEDQDKKNNANVRQSNTMSFKKDTQSRDEKDNEITFQAVYGEKLETPANDIGNNPNYEYHIIPHTTHPPFF